MGKNPQKSFVESSRTAGAIFLAVMFTAVGLSIGYLLFERYDFRTQEVRLYYKDIQKDPGVTECNADAYVTKEITYYKSEDPKLVTLNTLFEQMYSDAGQFTEDMGAMGVEVVSLVVKDGVATLTLDDTKGFTHGGACRVEMQKARITETLKQFEGVDEVKIQDKQGKTDTLFQP